MNKDERQSAALAAVALIERPRDDALDVLLDGDTEYLCTVISSAVWCARMLAVQLAEQLPDGTIEELVTALRGAVIDAFDDNPTAPNEEH